MQDPFLKKNQILNVIRIQRGMNQSEECVFEGLESPDLLAYTQMVMIGLVSGINKRFRHSSTISIINESMFVLEPLYSCLLLFFNFAKSWIWSHYSCSLFFKP
jgi:hypothetical protein